MRVCTLPNYRITQGSIGNTLFLQLTVATRGYSYGLRELKEIVYHSAVFLGDSQILSRAEHTPDDMGLAVVESQAIIRGVTQVYSKGVAPEDTMKFQELLEFYFPGGSKGGDSTGDPALMDAVRGQLKERHLQYTKTVMKKVGPHSMCIL